MAKYREKECSRCHQVLPANLMTTFTETEQAGSLGAGMSQTWGKGNQPRVHSGRKFYKRTRGWLCPQCADKRRSGKRIVYFLFLVLAAFSALAVYGAWLNG